MSQNDDVSANDIPDILAGTIGTEQAAYQNDQAAVEAGLAQDPNLLAEVLQPGFVELVDELAGDAPPTLGAVETVGQSYQDANGETMGQAFSDLQGQQADTPQLPDPGDVAQEIQQIEQQLEALEAELNPQPFPPAEDTESGGGFTAYESAEATPFEGHESFAQPTEEYGAQNPNIEY